MAFTPMVVPGMFLLLLFYVFSIQLYLGLPAEVDPTGRLTVWTSAMIPFGSAAGQTVVSIIATEDLHIAGYAVVTLVMGANLDHSFGSQTRSQGGRSRMAASASRL